MESLSVINIFVLVADTRSFTEAAKSLDVSPSAVSKSIVRMEERLGVRLFHRSTRSITLTSEGALFLERCRKILEAVEAAEAELSQLTTAPRGRLRVSMPLLGELMMPAIAGFMRRYPDIEMDIDMSDRMVAVIEEGFDAVIRTGEPQDSRLMSRQLGKFRHVLVASPAYLNERGTPQHPRDLADHACLLHKFPATGKIEHWPLQTPDATPIPPLTKTAICSTTGSQLYLARQGIGIACIPDFVVRDSLNRGELQLVLDEYVVHHGTLWMLWPSSRHASPKLRALIDYLKENLLTVIADK
ncbi:LysR family transcriptional regulator [Pseudomonas sp.]|uniref:LysR family transcriptional regulator n=1 Tax=Pseudomonas sp. TaxID=306 RepID=UPI00263490F8|nr:LysR family transcriptional regulator [Pseudomonas sp.]